MHQCGSWIISAAGWPPHRRRRLVQFVEAGSQCSLATRSPETCVCCKAWVERRRTRFKITTNGGVPARSVWRCGATVARRPAHEAKHSVRATATGKCEFAFYTSVATDAARPGGKRRPVVLETVVSRAWGWHVVLAHPACEIWRGCYHESASAIIHGYGAAATRVCFCCNSRDFFVGRNFFIGV